MAVLTVRASAMLSCLFISYDRSDLLSLAVTSVKPALNDLGIPSEVIVADDASAPAHRKVIEELRVDLRVYAPRNGGLGANSNRGIAACRGTLILQIQDDWEYSAPRQSLKAALDILGSDPEIGVLNLVNFDFPHPHELRTTPSGTRYRAFMNDMLDRERAGGVRPYSDTPHVKRIDFCRDLGPYLERVPMTVMELEFKRRVANQSRWRVAEISTPSLFRHLGADRSFNPSGRRARRIARIEALPGVGPAFHAARLLARSLLRRDSDD